MELVPGHGMIKPITRDNGNNVWVPDGPGPLAGAVTRPLVYLACPYSHPDRKVREQRFVAANIAAALLMTDRGEAVFSPISHTHPIAKDGALPLGWEFWSWYDRAVLSVCHKVYVLQLPGWQQSCGVAAETAIATEMGLPIEYLGRPWIGDVEAPAAPERSTP